MRNFGIPSETAREVVGGNDQPRGPRSAHSTRADNVIRLPDARPPLASRLNSELLRSAPLFISPLAADAPLPRGYLAQTMLDVITVLYWSGLAALLTVSFLGAPFALGVMLFFG